MRCVALSWRLPLETEDPFLHVLSCGCHSKPDAAPSQAKKRPRRRRREAGRHGPLGSMYGRLLQPRPQPGAALRSRPALHAAGTRLYCAAVQSMHVQLTVTRTILCWPHSSVGGMQVCASWVRQRKTKIPRKRIVVLDVALLKTWSNGPSCLVHGV